MPKIKLTDQQASELIDLLASEIDSLRRQRAHELEYTPAFEEMKHRESVLLEILEVLEDA